MAAAIASLRVVIWLSWRAESGLFDRRTTIPSHAVGQDAPAGTDVRGSSALREPVDRDRPHRLQPDATSRDVPHLAGHRERAKLVAHDVDPADLAERQGHRRRDGHPEPVAARVLGASEQRLVVDPQTDGPRDGEPWMTAAFGRRAHDPDRLTRTCSTRRPHAW